VIFVVLFVLFISFVGWLLGELYSSSGFGFLGVALLFSGVSSFTGYYFSDQIVLRMVGAKEVPYKQNPELHKLVENVSIASGIPKPRVFLTEDQGMNAFATGRDPQHAVICFTSGILQKLEKRELEGVIAHEMAHIGNYDIRLMSIVSVLAGTIVLVSDWFLRGSFLGGDRKGRGNSGAILMVVGLVFLVLSPLIATVIKLALSRNREYLADSTGALITRFPDGLADALIKINQDATPVNSESHAMAHMYISNPFKSESVKGLFNTHPPVEERIRILRSM
jgi:heat shock protein HtpX